MRVYWWRGTKEEIMNKRRKGNMGRVGEKGGGERWREEVGRGKGLEKKEEGKGGKR